MTKDTWLEDINYPSGGKKAPAQHPTERECSAAMLAIRESTLVGCDRGSAARCTSPNLCPVPRGYLAPGNVEVRTTACSSGQGATCFAWFSAAFRASRWAAPGSDSRSGNLRAVGMDARMLGTLPSETLGHWPGTAQAACDHSSFDHFLESWLIMQSLPNKTLILLSRYLLLLGRIFFVHLMLEVRLCLHAALQKVSDITAFGQHEAIPSLSRGVAWRAFPSLGSTAGARDVNLWSFSKWALANTSPAVRCRVDYLCVSKCLCCRNKHLPSTLLRACSSVWSTVLHWIAFQI